MAGGFDRQFLLCRAGRILCALPVSSLVEVMRPLPIQPMAGIPAFVAGLSVVRGATLPVVDIGVVLGESHPDAPRFVIVRTAGRVLAILVDQIIGLRHFGKDGMAELPPLLEDASSDALTAIGALDHDLVVFLETARLVPDDVLAAIDCRIAAAT